MPYLIIFICVVGATVVTLFVDWSYRKLFGPETKGKNNGR
jgi:hypothetical protein